MECSTRTTIAIYTACILLVCAQHKSALHAQSDTSQPSHRREAEVFHARFVNALVSGNRNHVAKSFRYPMQVRVLGLDNRLVAVKDAAAMAQMYPLFFGPTFRCAVEVPPHISDGVISMAGGQLIAQRINGVFRIIRLTVSLEAPIRSPAPVQVILPLHGKKQLGGRLARNGIDSYIVTARAGERLSARLERFPGRALSITVYNQKTQETLKGAATEYTRAWNASLPEDGSYRIEIQRRLSSCAPDVTYLVTFALQ